MTKHISISRFDNLDISRFYGMILVYYGHIAQSVMMEGSAIGTAQYKFIYSFHMPFFFLLAGIVSSPQKVTLPFMKYCKQLFGSRLIPYVVFNILLIGMSFFWKGMYFYPGDYTGVIGFTFMGFPVYSIPLWFLACLTSTEILYRIIAPLLSKTYSLLIAIVICYIGAYYINGAYPFLEKGHNFWFVNEAVMALAFFLVGVFIRRMQWTLEKVPPRVAITIACFLLGIVSFTWNANTGPFRMYEAVVVACSGYGHILLFPLTALAGSGMLLYMGQATGKNIFFAYLGRNSLSFLCLNSIFFHFINPDFAHWLVQYAQKDTGVTTALCLLFTLASMLICIPVIHLLTHFLPQLLGKRPQAAVCNFQNS